MILDNNISNSRELQRDMKFIDIVSLLVIKVKNALDEKN